MPAMWTKPQPGECPPYYVGAARLVPDGPLPEAALAEMDRLSGLLAGLSEADSKRAYAPGKWSIREVVGHITDTERVMAYRALSFARGDGAALPGMDQDEWAGAARHGERSLRSLMEELALVRGASVSLMRSLDPGQLGRRGTASGAQSTVRAICYFLVGHAAHHRTVLERRYL